MILMTLMFDSGVIFVRRNYKLVTLRGKTVKHDGRGYAVLKLEF